jgi:hypothetical protein
MNENRNAQWPSWADTPARRERNRQHWSRHNERVSVPEREQLFVHVRLGSHAIVVPVPVYRLHATQH